MYLGLSLHLPQWHVAIPSSPTDYSTPPPPFPMSGRGRRECNRQGTPDVVGRGAGGVRGVLTVEERD